jgi:hypothetical protein
MLTVEDGTGMATAESLCSAAFALAHHAARGNSAWAALPIAQQEQALRRATDYMSQIYRTKWKGVRLNATQALDWPRFGMYLEPVLNGAASAYPNLVASDIVPAEVARACAELALRASTQTLTPDVGRLKSRVKIGPIETEYVAGGSPYVRFQAIDNLLRPFLNGSGGMNVAAVRS